MKYMYLLVALFLVTIAGASAAYINESQGAALITNYSPTINTFDGMRFQVFTDISLVNVTRATGNTATTARLLNDSGTVLENSTTLSGNTFLFSGTTIMRAGSFYRIEVGTPGGTMAGRFSATPTFPRTGTTLNWTNRSTNGANVGTADELPVNILTIIVNDDINNLVVTAVDAYNSTPLTTFNATVVWNGTTTNYSTTNGTINTNATVNATLPANITVTANNYFTNEILNYNSNTFQANMIPYTAIRAFSLDGSAINSFSLNWTNTANSSDTGMQTVTNGLGMLPFFDATYELTIYDASNGSTSFARDMVNLTANPYLQSYNFTLYEFGSVTFIIKNVLTNNLINVSANITLSGTSGTYNFTTSNGTVFTENILDGLYFVTISASGFPLVQGILTVAEVYQVATFFVDASSEEATFSVLDTFNNPVYNATVTFYQSINGSYQTISQLLTDISGTFSVNLNPTVRYLVTSVSTGYSVFSGEIQPSQPQTYIIRMQLPSEVPGSSVFSNLFYTADFTYDNNTPSFIIFDYEVNSQTGELEYFWANTSYLGTDYFTNISGIPGGGVIQFNITGFNISIENEFNLTIAFKRTGFDEVVIVVPFYIEFYENNQYSAYTGLFNLPLGAGGKAIIGTIILLIAIAGMWSISSSSEATMITGMVLTGLFSVPAIGLFPIVFGLITVSVLGIIIIGDATVNR